MSAATLRESLAAADLKPRRRRVPAFTELGVPLWSYFTGPVITERIMPVNAYAGDCYDAFDGKFLLTAPLS